MTKTVVEILKEARELISAPERWTRGYYAADRLGRFTGVDAPDACKWCSAGALAHVAGMDFGDALNILDDCARDLGFTSIIDLNDTRPHPTVLKAFDLAISKAEAGQ